MPAGFVDKKPQIRQLSSTDFPFPKVKMHFNQSKKEAGND